MRGVSRCTPSVPIRPEVKNAWLTLLKQLNYGANENLRSTPIAQRLPEIVDELVRQLRGLPVDGDTPTTANSGRGFD